MSYHPTSGRRQGFAFVPPQLSTKCKSSIQQFYLNYCLHRPNKRERNEGRAIIAGLRFGNGIARQQPTLLHIMASSLCNETGRIAASI